MGIDLQLLSNQEKTMLVDALKQAYALRELLAVLGPARSSYFCHRARLLVAGRHAGARRVIADTFERNHRCYGYRRIRAALNRQQVSFDGIWCVPASPYQNMEGALLAIRHARENAIPFLGTCGGFQHAIIEYARNVLGWTDAEHAETAPGAPRTVISPLECALVETVDRVHLFPGTRIAAAYGASETTEGYRCRYGLNPQFRASLVSGPLRVAGDDARGDVRVVEMDGHPFFVATLFQPERAALRGESAPIVNAFVRACAA